MPTLSTARLAQLLAPYHPDVPERMLEQFSLYLDLLLKWNARTNLTAIRDPEEIVQRHFGESLFAACHVPVAAQTLLDLGSGAGFPGIPIQLAHPHLSITLAESQNKKGAFLREAVRMLDLPSKVYAERAETLVSSIKFDVVALRAVDRPSQANALAKELLKRGGVVLHLSSSGGNEDQDAVPIPNCANSVLRILRE